MILMPCSLTHATNLPLNDHFTPVIVPSPECNTVSLPVLPLRPILPSHPDAAAAAELVFAFSLTPVRPPVVRISAPARPPDMYVLSFLKSGERATALTGRA